MDALQVGEVVIVVVNAQAEVQASVSPVDELEVPKLEQVQRHSIPYWQVKSCM
jgi:hypothetical protein